MKSLRKALTRLFQEFGQRLRTEMHSGLLLNQHLRWEGWLENHTIFSRNWDCSLTSHIRMYGRIHTAYLNGNADGAPVGRWYRGQLPRRPTTDAKHLHAFSSIIASAASRFTPLLLTLSSFWHTWRYLWISGRTICRRRQVLDVSSSMCSGLLARHC